MEFIALFIPSFITMSIKLRRGTLSESGVFSIIFEYAQNVLWTNFFVVSIVTYLLGMDDVQSNALKSFPFFTKYVVIAVIWAFFLPYIQEVGKRYIKIHFHIKEE